MGVYWPLANLPVDTFFHTIISRVCGLGLVFFLALWFGWRLGFLLGFFICLGLGLGCFFGGEGSCLLGFLFACLVVVL